jgi:hypothetical protein
VDLAGHLRCVADDYHEYLDDAPGSRLARLMAANAPADSLIRKLARQNAAELAALVLAAWRGGMPQLWPELAGWDGDDPWHYLLTASSRNPEWHRSGSWRRAGVESVIREL